MLRGNRYLEPTTIQIQGARVRFTSDFESLNEFALTHFADAAAARDRLLPAPSDGNSNDQDQADIDARVEWIEGIPPKANYQMIAPDKARPDRDIELGDKEIAWSRIDDFLPLRLRFLLKENLLRVDGRHYFF